MLGVGKKGLETKAENNLGSLLSLVSYAFLFSLSQKEYPERISNLGDSMNAEERRRIWRQWE